jgi:hypothetical protein
MIWRIALGMAGSHAAEHRWRRLAIPIASVFFMVCLLSSASLLAMQGREEARLANRAATLAISPAETDLLTSTTFEDIGDKQAVIVWLEPAGTAAPVLPPGLETLPESGTFVVSPALARLIESQPGLEARFQERTVLDRSGVLSGEELFAYARVPQGRTIAADFRTQRISGFGADNAQIHWDYWPRLHRFYLAMGALICLVLPGLFVLAAGLTSASSLRDRRLLVLRSIGVKRDRLVELSIAEGLLLSLPGVLLPAAMWFLFAPRVTTVPLVGNRVFAGDLAIGLLGMTISLVLAVVCILAIAGIGANRVVSGKRAVPRPSLPSAMMSWFRFLPAAVTLGLAWYTLQGSRSSANESLFLVLIACSLVCIPFVYAGLVKSLGAELGSLKQVSIMLAGRNLSWDAVRLTRPFAGLGTVLMIALVWAAITPIFSSTESPSYVDRGVGTAEVSWTDPQDGDLAALQQALPGDLVVTMTIQSPEVLPADAGEAMPPEPVAALGTTCAQLSTIFPSSQCRTDQPSYLPPDLVEGIAGTLPMTVGDVRLVDPTSIPQLEQTVMVFGRGTAAEVHDRVTVEAWRVLPMARVTSIVSFVKHSDDRNIWLVSAVVASLFVIAIASVVSLVDRLIANRLQRTVLLRIGLTTRRLRTLEGWLFLAPYLTVFATSLVAGVGMSWMIVNWYELSFPWSQVGIIAALALLAGGIGTVAVMTQGVTTVKDQPAIRR